ncbi:MAG: hypothetical protein WC406_07365 [Methanoregula sp.]
MSSSSGMTDASSHPIATMLIILLVVLLAAIVLAMVMMMPSLAWEDKGVPSIFKILSVTHDPNLDSRVVMQHTGITPYQNDHLMAKFYKNGEPVTCNIQTFHGTDFIPTPHIGVQTMGGEGCKGNTWLPREKVALDFSDRTFHPGDLVMAEIYDTTTDLIVSRHSFRA